MQHIIIGTAGHVDHGKTALIEALTGYNGDELAEEKTRGITIDLSFSNLEENGKNIAFIDTPGHNKLIKNMISGAFGFNSALLVVAANEGIMPQTKEHLNVLKIVGVKSIIVALTKVDLADENIIIQREKEIQKLIKEHDIELLDIAKTSIYNKESILNLKKLLFKIEEPPIIDEPFFRYYIDRIFSPKGVGTITTGTVISGNVKIGDKLQIAEFGKKSTIVKNIQIHGKNSKSATTHQRVALQLDIPHTKLNKGYLLCSLGYFRGFKEIDCNVTLLDNATLPHNSEIVFITGSKRVEAKVLYYSDSNFAKIKLSDKIFAKFKDPYIIIYKGRVVAGGKILAPITDPIRKNQKLPLLQALNKSNYKEAFKILLANHKRGFGLISSLQRFGLEHQKAIEIAKKLNGIFVDEKELVLYPLKAQESIYNSIKKIYKNNPRALLSANSLALRIKWASVALIELVLQKIKDEKYLSYKDGLYFRTDINFKDIENSLDEKIYNILDKEGLSPQAPYNLYESLDLDRKKGDSILKRLTKSKRLIRLEHNLFVTDKNLNKALKLMKELIVKRGYLDIKILKEETNLSRKYTIAYLEYLDKSNEIKKDGNKRVFKYTP